MRVFVAGATGAIGRPLVPMLLERGHEVVAMTRSATAAERLRAAGADTVTCDAFDPEGVVRVVGEAQPDVLVHQLTAIPARIRPRRYGRDLELTNRLRTEATHYLLAGAGVGGVGRVVVQSIAFAYRPGPGRAPWTEDDPLWLDAPGEIRTIVGAVHEMESRVTAAPGTGVVLRYGYFYGPGTAYARDGQFGRDVSRRRLPIVGDGGGVFSFIHVADAAAATVRAVESEAAGIFNVVDDDPAPMAEWLPGYAEALGAAPPRRVPLWLGRLATGGAFAKLMTEGRGASNRRAKTELGLELRHPSWREGFAAALREEVAGGAAGSGRS